MAHNEQGLERAAKRLRLLHESMSQETDEFLHKCLDVLENALVLREDADVVTVACIAINDIYSAVDFDSLPAGHLLSPVELTDFLVSDTGCSWGGVFRQLRCATFLPSIQ